MSDRLNSSKKSITCKEYKPVRKTNIRKSILIQWLETINFESNGNKQESQG
jgi:hypothetical protein